MTGSYLDLKGCCLYTDVTSKYFVRRKVRDQSKTANKVMVILFSIAATQRGFSTLRPVGP
jgi:hypothetical protein